MIEKTNAKRDADDTDANPTTAPANEHAAAPPPDPFDPAALRLDQTFLEGGGAKKLLLTVPVRKPGRHDFVRVRAEPNFRENLAVIELKEERETYLIHPAVAGESSGRVFHEHSPHRDLSPGRRFLVAGKTAGPRWPHHGITERRGRRRACDASVGQSYRRHEPWRVSDF